MRLLAYRQILVMSRACDGAVDVGKLAAAFGVPGPDFRWLILLVIAHFTVSRTVIGWRRGATVMWLIAKPSTEQAVVE